MQLDWTDGYHNHHTRAFDWWVLDLIFLKQREPTQSTGPWKTKELRSTTLSTFEKRPTGLGVLWLRRVWTPIHLDSSKLITMRKAWKLWFRGDPGGQLNCALNCSALSTSRCHWLTPQLVVSFRFHLWSLTKHSDGMKQFARMSHIGITLIL